jgi:methylmalonyl-CoA carboxyltransferase 12S subunit
MNSETNDRQVLLQAIESLRAETARLSERVAALEGAAQHRIPAVPALAAVNHAFATPVADETLICVLSAAVAAYLGIQPRIRQIRLVGGTSWAQQGRVTIQASHALSIHHG